MRLLGKEVGARAVGAVEAVVEDGLDRLGVGGAVELREERPGDRLGVVAGVVALEGELGALARVEQQNALAAREERVGPFDLGAELTLWKAVLASQAVRGDVQVLGSKDGASEGMST